MGLLDRFKKIGRSLGRSLGRPAEIIKKPVSRVRNFVVDRGILRRSEPIQRRQEKFKSKGDKDKGSTSSTIDPFSSTTYFDPAKNRHVDRRTGRIISKSEKDKRLVGFRTKMLIELLKFKNPRMSDKKLKDKIKFIEEQRKRFREQQSTIKDKQRRKQMKLDFDQFLSNVISP